MSESRRYASRAGEKLEHALRAFSLDPTGLICADLGCHAGGFTDCLLQHGAARVYAVDTSYHILDWKLRNDDRVVVMERTNALHVVLPEPVALISIDVGWTPQRLIIPHALSLLGPGGRLVSLLKPHYEATDRERIRGKVRPELVPEVLERTLEAIRGVGAVVEAVEESPVRGAKGGNTEYLALLMAAPDTVA